MAIHCLIIIRASVLIIVLYAQVLRHVTEYEALLATLIQIIDMRKGVNERLCLLLLIALVELVLQFFVWPHRSEVLFHGHTVQIDCLIEPAFLIVFHCIYRLKFNTFGDDYKQLLIRFIILLSLFLLK